MLQNRKLENIKEGSLDNKQEQNQEQKPESLAGIKERKEEAIGGGISKAVEKMSALGKKLLGVLKRISGGAEYILVAPEAIVGAAKTVYGKAEELDSKIDDSMDRAADWTSHKIGEAGEGIRELFYEKYEKHEALGGWAKEKITGFKERGREAVRQFSEKRKDTKQRQQELKRAWERSESQIKSEKKIEEFNREIQKYEAKAEEYRKLLEEVCVLRELLAKVNEK